LLIKGITNTLTFSQIGIECIHIVLEKTTIKSRTAISQRRLSTFFDLFSGSQHDSENRFSFASEKMKLKSQTDSKSYSLEKDEVPFTRENRLRISMTKVRMTKS